MIDLKLKSLFKVDGLDKGIAISLKELGIAELYLKLGKSVSIDVDASGFIEDCVTRTCIIPVLCTGGISIFKPKMSIALDSKFVTSVKGNFGVAGEEEVLTVVFLAYNTKVGVADKHYKLLISKLFNVNINELI